jgi:hypothetical protein
MSKKVKKLKPIYQKFFHGDLVVIDGLGSRRNRGNAIVLSSCAEESHDHGRVAQKNFNVYLLNEDNTLAWIHEDEMTLVEPDRLDLIPETNFLRRVMDAKKARDAALVVK